jgi:hypothetical protein
MPTQEHFQHAPCGARFVRCPACEISTFRSGQTEATRIVFGYWFLLLKVPFVAETTPDSDFNASLHCVFRGVMFRFCSMSQGAK